MADLSSLTADQLAERAKEPWGADTRAAALAELCRRLKTAEDALEQIVALRPPDEDMASNIARSVLAAIRPNPKP